MSKYWTKINDSVEGPYEQHVLQYLDGFSQETLVSLDDPNLTEIWIKAAEIKNLNTPIKTISISISGLNPSEPPGQDTVRIITGIKPPSDEALQKEKDSADIKKLSENIEEEQKKNLSEFEESLGKLSDDSLDKLTETSFDDIVLHPEQIHSSTTKEVLPGHPEVDQGTAEIKEPPDVTVKETESPTPRFPEKKYDPKKVEKSPGEAAKPPADEDLLASDMLDLMGKIDAEMGTNRDNTLELKPDQPKDLEPTVQEPKAVSLPEAAPTPVTLPKVEIAQDIDLSLNPKELIGKPHQFTTQTSRDIKKPVIIYCGIIIAASLIYFGYITGTLDHWIESASSLFSKEHKTTLQELHEQNPVKKFVPLQPIKAEPPKAIIPVKRKKPIARKRIAVPPVKKKAVAKKAPPKKIKLESQEFLLPGVRSPNVDSEKIEKGESTDTEISEKTNLQEAPAEKKKEIKAEDQFKDLEWMDTTGWGQ